MFEYMGFKELTKNLSSGREEEYKCAILIDESQVQITAKKKKQKHTKRMEATKLLDY